MAGLPVNSDSWDDEWLEEEIARELAACEDYEDEDPGPPDAETQASMEQRLEELLAGRHGGDAGSGSGSGSSGDGSSGRGGARRAWEQSRADARARARPSLPQSYDVPLDPSDRPSKDGGRGQSREDDAIDALVTYMQERDVKYAQMEAQMSDDIGAVTALAAGVEREMAAAGVAVSTQALPTTT